jgi:hypothetical protein
VAYGGSFLARVLMLNTKRGCNQMLVHVLRRCAHTFAKGILKGVPTFRHYPSPASHLRLSLSGTGSIAMPNIPVCPAREQLASKPAMASRLAKPVPDLLHHARGDANTNRPTELAIPRKDPLPVHLVPSSTPRTWLRVAKRVRVLSRKLLHPSSDVIAREHISRRLRRTSCS